MSSMDTAMEFSFWKEEPLSPAFSGLEYQTDVWGLFEDDVAKQGESPKDDTLDTLGSQGAWLPDSPGDSCDSLENLKIETYIHHARAQLASQLLQDLDEVLIKEEPFAEPWYEQKTDLSMFDELPSPTPSLGKEEPLAGAAASSRPFSGLSLSMPLSGYVTATPAPAFSLAPAAPAAVLVPLSTVQQLQQPDNAAGLLCVVQLQQQQQQLQQSVIHHHHPQQQLHQQQLAFQDDTQQLLQEFDFVFGKVEQSHGGALTPPQSPPHHQYQQQQQQPTATIEYHPQPQHQAAVHVDNFAALTPIQQQQQLIREVDELEDSRLQQQQQQVAVVVEEAAWPQLTSFAPPSPCTSSNSSSSSSCGFLSDSPAPASPETSSSETSDDPEWLPGDDSPDNDNDEAEAQQQQQQRSSSARGGAPGKDGTPAGNKKRAGAKARAKPYSHEDKRVRKKEQNKNAATRYRMKKKAEVEEILGEENGLRARNDELHAKVADLSQEIRYLKNLMREVFVRRGLLKST